MRDVRYRPASGDPPPGAGGSGRKPVRETAGVRIVCGRESSDRFGTAGAGGSLPGVVDAAGGR